MKSRAARLRPLIISTLLPVRSVALQVYIGKSAISQSGSVRRHLKVKDICSLGRVTQTYSLFRL